MAKKNKKFERWFEKWLKNQVGKSEDISEGYDIFGYVYAWTTKKKALSEFKDDYKELMQVAFTAGEEASTARLPPRAKARGFRRGT